MLSTATTWLYALLACSPPARPYNENEHFKTLVIMYEKVIKEEIQRCKNHIDAVKDRWPSWSTNLQISALTKRIKTLEWVLNTVEREAVGTKVNPEEPTK